MHLQPEALREHVHRHGTAAKWPPGSSSAAPAVGCTDSCALRSSSPEGSCHRHARPPESTVSTAALCAGAPAMHGKTQSNAFVAAACCSGKVRCVHDEDDLLGMHDREMKLRRLPDLRECAG